MGVNSLTYSKDGLLLTERFEGCVLKAYHDQVGVLTIGYGHTGPDVKEGLAITQAQAQEILAKDLEIAAACVNRVVSIPLTQQEFEALVDFVFNLGAGAFEHSTLLKALNANNLVAAVRHFEEWDHAGGVIVAGLLRRRQAEAQLFEGGNQTLRNA